MHGLEPVILFRSDYSVNTLEEKQIAADHFDVYSYRSEIPTDSLVIGRYSVLPFYGELEVDLKHNGSKLINTSTEHNWIADFSYYHDLKDFTPKSWFEHEFPYSDYEGPFIVKGRTNSRKSHWKTKMFAANRREAVELAAELAIDPLIGPQGIVYRQFIPLKTFEVDSISGVPHSNEWRMFFYKGNLLTYGYYWSTASEKVVKTAILSQRGLEFGKKIGKIVADFTSFYVIDIAETDQEDWILVEVNDGQMSGLSECNANELYNNLRLLL